MTEKEKMLQCQWYNANYDENLLQDRLCALDLCYELDHTKPSDLNTRCEILKKILQVETLPENLGVQSPFLCDYGFNVHFGKDNFIGPDSYFMDGASITLGDHEFIGPHCGFYTASHPMTYRYRNIGLEKASPITVGDNCWFGAGVSVLPGVHIGKGCVIAAGSVITHDIPDNSLAAGVPAEVKKTINQEEEVL